MTAYLAESLAMRHRLNQPIADDDPPGQRTFIGYPPPDQVGLRQAHQTEVYEEA